jgi:hypothetical protein
MRSEDGYGVPEERYSAECVEVEFSEVQGSKRLPYAASIP